MNNIYILHSAFCIILLFPVFEIEKRSYTSENIGYCQKIEDSGIKSALTVLILAGFNGASAHRALRKRISA
jgi:hypothetical protein